MEMGAGFPEQLISTLRMNNVGLTRRGKSLMMASCQKSLKFEKVAANTRRLFGSRGNGGLQAVLITEEAVEPCEGDGDKDTCVAYKKAGRREVGTKKEDGAL